MDLELTAPPPDPPADYFYPAVDLLGSLDSIEGKAASGGFSSQYEFDLAVQQLIYSAHDGHLYLTPWTSRSISFQRGDPPLQLVSVSEDGIKLPKIYILRKMPFNFHVNLLTIC